MCYFVERLVSAAPKQNEVAVFENCDQNQVEKRNNNESLKNLKRDLVGKRQEEIDDHHIGIESQAPAAGNQRNLGSLDEKKGKKVLYGSRLGYQAGFWLGIG